MTEPEQSPSGSPIYRHSPRKIEFTPAHGDSERIEALGEHIEEHIGKIDVVLHEILSDLVHIDIHVIRPTAERNYITLITTGMSEAPMTVPEGAEDFRYGELLIHLPPDWPIPEDVTTWQEEHYWPVRLLKVMARMPHEYDTWLGFGHTIASGEDLEPYHPSTKMCAALLVSPFMLPEEAWVAELTPDIKVNFYSVMPIYREELQHKMDQGLGALGELFDKYKTPQILDPKRRNVCRKRFWFF